LEISLRTHVYLYIDAEVAYRNIYKYVHTYKLVSTDVFLFSVS